MQQIFLSDAQLAERYGVSRSTIWRWAGRNLLPTPVQLSPGTTRWRLDAIESHDADKQQPQKSDDARVAAVTPPNRIRKRRAKARNRRRAAS